MFNLDNKNNEFPRKKYKGVVKTQIDKDKIYERKKHITILESEHQNNNEKEKTDSEKEKLKK